MVTKPAKARRMDSDTFSSIVWGAVVFGFLISFFLAYRRYRRRTTQVLVMELFKQYFEGAMPPDQLGQRTRRIANHNFIGSAEFHSLAVAGFQRAVDAKLRDQPHSKQDERKLLSLLATLKNEFGLTDLYQIEGWRSGRE